MATLDDMGREILDQTPVSLPLKYDRPEPLHLRIRRMILEATQEQHDGFETLEEANDFEVDDDPSSFDTAYTEPDLEPVQQYTDEEIAAARAAVEALRKSKEQPPATPTPPASLEPEAPKE